MLGVIECQESKYYIQFYKEALDNYIDNTIDIVLISLAGTEQLVSTFTLCKCIKSKYPNVKIILGGNPFTKIKGKIDDSWIVFFEQLFDFLLLYEGEYSLRDLLLCLVNNQDVEAVPNCIYMKNNRIFKTKEDIRTVDIENSFIPDFSDYNLSCYDTPEVILPYYIERGCYWKKCTFCDHDFGYADCYRIKSIEKVIEDLKTYIDLYNVKYIHFVDEAIPPKFIEKMCYAFLENGIKISWFTCIKASKYFTNELCSLMEKAGCVFVSIGVESCCQSVLDNMKKGITVEEIEFTLENMKKNNIWAHSFMINNFEAETYADKWRSFSFVVNHKEIFPSIGIGNFTLSKNAKIFPLVDENRIGESVDAFSNDLPYETEESLDDDEYRALVKVYMEMNYTSYFFSKYLFEREHIAIFMSHLNKCQFLNSKCLEASVKRAIDYNARFILQNEDHDKLYIYTLLERKFYILPNMFRNVINEAKKYIESSENRVEDSNNSLLKFILDKLYV